MATRPREFHSFRMISPIDWEDRVSGWCRKLRKITEFMREIVWMTKI